MELARNELAGGASRAQNRPRNPRMNHFDITRLCHRASYPSPSGIDRVDLAYLKWLRETGPVEYLVNGVAGFSVIAERLGEAFADKLAAVWKGARGAFRSRPLKSGRFCRRWE